jgi:hypothetical protein
MNELLKTKQNFDFVFICGSTQTEEFVYDSVGKIIYAKCGDHYEDLPLKVYMGIKFILSKFTNVDGIFKTDDNANILNPAILLDTIENNKCIDYFGLFNESKKRPQMFYTLKRSRLKKFHNPDNYIGKKYTFSLCCYGFGYYISIKSCNIILDNYDIVKNEVLEDSCIGLILNKNNIYPVKIKHFDETVIWDV